MFQLYLQLERIFRVKDTRFTLMKRFECIRAICSEMTSF